MPQDFQSFRALKAVSVGLSNFLKAGVKCALFLTGLSFLNLVLLAKTSAAQLVPGGRAPGLYSSSKLEPRDTNSLEVQVRAPNGGTLDTLAVVSVLNLSGQLITSKTTFGSTAQFTPLNQGQYIVSVEAAGYAKAEVAAAISSDHGQALLVVTLKPEDANGLHYAAPSGIILAPKAQKEASKGSEALQANKYDEAIKHLEAAHRLAPNHPDVGYMLGVAYEKKNDLASAKKHWDDVLAAQPGHLLSLLAAGDISLRQDDLVSARKYLDKAVEVAPNSWQAHTLLATTLLRQGSYPDAVTHSERAMDLGKGQASTSLLILGQALAAERQNRAAVAALRDYLATKPTQTKAVEDLIAKLEKSPDAPPGAIVGGVTDESVSLEKDLPGMPLPAAAAHWLPPNVDDAVSPVEPGVSCSLDDVLKGVSARVQELPAVVDRYTATEVLHQEDVNNAGVADSVADLSFNYLASVREIKNKYGESLDVQEYRNGSTGTEMFPNKMASVGLPSIVLIFHPILVKDFDMKCEGLSRAQGSFAWQIYFRQRADQESRIRRYRVGGHIYPIALKGRAWIDANTFQVVRLETDLREAHPELRLNSEHLVMEYGPVTFKSRKEELWLPSSADYYAVLRGQRFHRRHSFTNYILFSIEDKQQLGAPPKDKTSGSGQR